MTLLELEFSAFGPFAERQTVNFANAQRAGVFLIQGPTGSGKTSILDALCFALYGDSSGNERSAQAMRSHHVEDSVPTQVRVDFELEGLVYRVRRSMSGKRDQRSTEKLSLETLGPPVVTVSDKRSECQERINAMLRLNAAQFRQVIVLPQGKFREFLVAKSNERETLLASLFETARLEALVDGAQSARQAALADLTASKGLVDAIFERLGVETGEDAAALSGKISSELKEAHDSAETTRRELDEAGAAVTAAKAITAARLELEREETRLKVLDSQKSGYDEISRKIDRAGKAAQIRHKFETARAAQTALNELIANAQRQRTAAELAGSSLKDLEKTQSLIRADYEGLDGLRDSSRRLQTYAERARESESTAFKIAQARADAANIEQSSRKTADERTRLSEQSSRKKTELATQKKRAAATVGLEKLGERLRTLEEIQRLRDSSGSLSAERKAELVRLEAQVPVETARVESLKTSLASARQAHSSLAAHELALALVDGEACPVCGSIHHPRPASDADSFAAASLADLETQFDSARASLAAQENRATIAKERIKDHESTLAALDTRYLDSQKEIGDLLAESSEVLSALARWQSPSADSSQLAAQVANSLSEAQSAADEATRLEGELEHDEHRLRQADDDLLTMRTRLQELEKSRLGFEEELTQTQRHIDREFADEKKRFGESRAAFSAVTEQDARIRKIEQSWKDGQEKAERLKLKISGIERVIEETAASIGRAETETSALSTAWAAAWTESGFSSSEDAISALMNGSALESARSELEAFSRELGAARVRVSELRTRAQSDQTIDLEALELRESTAQAAFEEGIRRHESLSQTLAATEDALKRLSELQTELAARSDAVDQWTALHRVLSGQEAEQNYVSLQRYALSVYLDEIIDEANRHLNQMSRGRFELLRQDSTSAKRRTGGLELFVLDAYTGTSRQAESLSGGEGFLAALSLALGLSSVVSASGGGIRLQSLFVDEGFGSLDEDALQDAMQVLAHLSEHGRMVGIISHVKDLQERIPVQLIVDKGPRGSRVYWKK